MKLISRIAMTAVALSVITPCFAATTTPAKPMMAKHTTMTAAQKKAMMKKSMMMKKPMAPMAKKTMMTKKPA